MFAALIESFREIASHRELVYQLMMRDVRIRYKQALFGFLWAVFLPLVVIGAGMVVRYAAAQVAGTALNEREIAGMAVKAVGWTFFTGALGTAVIALLANQNLITKIAFPREVLPMAAVLASVLDAAVGATAVALLVLVLGIPLSLQVVWIFLLSFHLLMLTLGFSAILAAGNLFFRDVKYMVQVALTFGVFFTPVIYEPAMLGPVGARLAMLNPVAPVLEGLRLALIEGHNLATPLLISRGGSEILAWHPMDLVISLVLSVAACLGALLLYRRLTYVFAEYV